MTNRDYKILIAGDLLPSSGNYELFSKGKVEALFGAKILQLFSDADFSIFNLEGPITNAGVCKEKNGPSIKVGPETLPGIRQLGVSAVSLANNHIVDYGNLGYLDTINALDEAGIKHAGAGINEDNIEKYLSFYIGMRKVCIYCVSETFFNVPSKNEAGAHIYDEYIVCNELKDLKKTHDYIVVLYHGGAEYFQYPTPLVRKRCHRMADCGADCIITQHSHCIGCEEHYNHSYILYGQGNFHYTRQKSYPNLTKDGLLIEIMFHETGNKIQLHHFDIIDNVIRYSDNQELEDFKERSAQINDLESIGKKYRSLKLGEISNKYLLAYKGKFPLRRFLLFVIPSFIKRRLLKSFERKHLIQILATMSCERANEDMKQVIYYMLGKTKE